MPLAIICKTRNAMYVETKTVACSNDYLNNGNKSVLSFQPLTHARPYQQHNTYLTICVLLIVALRTSLPVTGNTLRASFKIPHIVVRLKQV